MLTTPALVFGLMFCASIWFMLAFGTRWGGEVDSTSLICLLRKRPIKKMPWLKSTHHRVF